jgi:hypothetical protein
MAIDLLSELESRTEGHRSADESRLLQGALTDLRLNYLDEMKKSQAESQKAEAPGEADDDAASAETEDPEATNEADDDSAPVETEDAEAKG